MSDLDNLKKRIEEKLSTVEEKKKTAYQQQQANNMEALEKSRRFSEIAQPIIDDVILPRLERLVSYFDNARFVEEPGRSRTNQLIELEDCKRFPVSVKLGLSLGSDRTVQHLIVYYHLEILPVLIPFDRNAEISFSVESLDLEKLTDWVEDRICGFVDTYLQLEDSGQPQSSEQVIDPVCGMRILKQFAVSFIEHKGHTYYFCVDECRLKFAECPEKYVADSSQE